MRAYKQNHEGDLCLKPITLFRSYVRELQDEFEDEYNNHIDIVDIQDEFLAWMRGQLRRQKAYKQKETDFKEAVRYASIQAFNYFYEQMQEYWKNYHNEC